MGDLGESHRILTAGPLGAKPASKCGVEGCPTRMKATAPIDRSRLTRLLERERATYKKRNPRSFQAYMGSLHLFGRVPMTWMNKAAASTWRIAGS